MKKKILVFSNGEKIGDGIIKLPLLYEIKKRLPDYHLTWVTNLGTTVYNRELKNIAGEYIDEIIEKVNLNPFFWRKISPSYNFKKHKYDYILDTQKAIYRTIGLKRIQSNIFISASANGFFSTIKIKKKNIRNYYLYDLYDLLNLIKYEEFESDFKINLPSGLNNILEKFFKNNNKYFGIAPGAGEKNKIWPLEKFIEIGKYYQKKNYKLVFYIGPSEINIKHILIKEFPEALIPEDYVKNYSNIEVIMASTKYLSFALANDSGISHILSTNHCPVIKLFGPKNSNKFTPKKKLIKTISSSEYNSKNVSDITVDRVIMEIRKFLN